MKKHVECALETRLWHHSINSAMVVASPGMPRRTILDGPTIAEEPQVIRLDAQSRFVLFSRAAAKTRGQERAARHAGIRAILPPGGCFHLPICRKTPTGHVANFGERWR